MAPSGSTQTEREVSTAVVAAEKDAKMRTVEEATVAKAVEEAATVKLAVDKASADRATSEKVATDKAAVTKAAEEAVAKVTMDAAAMKTADQGATATRTTVGSVGFNSSSSPTPAAGSKRVAALGGSTPPSKRFCYA
jgi:membrane protein involved in colicin uptake